MKTVILVARHGNTFTTEQTPTRIGVRTDLPLVESGLAQAASLGRYLARAKLIPNIVYASSLKRAMQTADGVLRELGLDTAVRTDCRFDEIDYGPDENKSEPEVIARIGQAAIDAWNQSAAVPPNWLVDPKAIATNWIDFADDCQRDHPGKIILVVTSNGVARFSPHVTGQMEHFQRNHKIKIATGALCIFEKENIDNQWKCVGWNIKPD